MKFLFLLACVLVGSVGVPYYLWQQTVQLPAWYADQSPQSPQPTSRAIALDDAAALQQARQNVRTKLAEVQPTPDGTAAVEFTGTELNDLLATQIAAIAQDQNLAAAVKQINTTIANNKLETGAVVKLDQLSNSDLAGSEQAILQQIVQAIPGLGTQEVYVGIEGRPRVENGQLRLDALQVRVGNLRFSIADIAARLGISEAELQQELDRQLPLDRLGIRDVQLVGDRLQFRGGANQ